MPQGVRISNVAAEKRFPLLVWARGDCWEYRGTRRNNGIEQYGAFWVDPIIGRVVAHRFAYEMAKGPIPAGMVLDHICRHPWCVRPSHLEAVTDRVNVLRGVGMGARMARKSVCKYGHPFTARTEEGHRRCLVCYEANKERRRAAYVRKGYHRKRPTHCPRGHEYTPENTYHVAARASKVRTYGPTILCRECYRTRARERHAKKRCVVVLDKTTAQRLTLETQTEARRTFEALRLERDER